MTQILPPDNNLGGFGYDATWLADILPPRLDSPQHASPSIANVFSANPNGLLNASYGMREAPYLTEARAAYAKVTAARGNTSARLHEVVNGKPGQSTLQQEQLRFEVYGNAVYGIGAPGASSYRNFNQDQYDRVLAWASYAVMSSQANALDAIAAYASQNVTAARSELRATVVWAAYVGAYAWGNLNTNVTAAQPLYTFLPSFVVGPCAIEGRGRTFSSTTGPRTRFLGHSRKPGDGDLGISPASPRNHTFHRRQDLHDSAAD